VITIQAWWHCVVVTAIMVKHVNLKLVWLKLWFALRENIQGVCQQNKINILLLLYKREVTFTPENPEMES
jgi:hypothetical protein